jgi:hypothetical protein
MHYSYKLPFFTGKLEIKYVDNGNTQRRSRRFVSKIYRKQKYLHSWKNGFPAIRKKNICRDSKITGNFQMSVPPR